LAAEAVVVGDLATEEVVAVALAVEAVVVGDLVTEEVVVADSEAEGAEEVEAVDAVEAAVSRAVVK